jgi:hypothetical protein
MTVMPENGASLIIGEPAHVVNFGGPGFIRKIRGVIGATFLLRFPA